MPEESVEAYRQHWDWCLFQNIVGKNLTGIDQVETAVATSTKEVYDLRGAKVAASLEGLPQGTYIVRNGQKTKKISVK